MVAIRRLPDRNCLGRYRCGRMLSADTSPVAGASFDSQRWLPAVTPITAVVRFAVDWLALWSAGYQCRWTVACTFKAKDECGNYLNNQPIRRSGMSGGPIGSAPAAITVNELFCLPTQSEADASFDAALAASGYTRTAVVVWWRLSWWVRWSVVVNVRGAYCIHLK